MKVYLFANKPGMYFLETNEVSLDEIDKEAYCAKEVKDFDPEVMEMLVGAGIQGYFSAPDDCARAETSSTTRSALRFGQWATHGSHLVPHSRGLFSGP